MCVIIVGEMGKEQVKIYGPFHSLSAALDWGSRAISGEPWDIFDVYPAEE